MQVHSGSFFGPLQCTEPVVPLLLMLKMCACYAQSCAKFMIYAMCNVKVCIAHGMCIMCKTVHSWALGPRTSVPSRQLAIPQLTAFVAAAAGDS